MMKVQTVAGMLTNLPCNITPSGEFHKTFEGSYFVGAIAKVLFQAFAPSELFFMI